MPTEVIATVHQLATACKNTRVQYLQTRMQMSQMYNKEDYENDKPAITGVAEDNRPEITGVHQDNTYEITGVLTMTQIKIRQK